MTRWAVRARRHCVNDPNWEPVAPPPGGAGKFVMSWITKDVNAMPCTTMISVEYGLNKDGVITHQRAAAYFHLLTLASKSRLGELLNFKNTSLLRPLSLSRDVMILANLTSYLWKFLMITAASLLTYVSNRGKYLRQAIIHPESFWFACHALSFWLVCSATMHAHSKDVHPTLEYKLRNELPCQRLKRQSRHSLQSRGLYFWSWKLRLCWFWKKKWRTSKFGPATINLISCNSAKLLRGTTLEVRF